MIRSRTGNELERHAETGMLTEHGVGFHGDQLGIDLGLADKRRRCFLRACIDWTERRPHLGGAVGSAIFERLAGFGWIERIAQSRAPTITPLGAEGRAVLFSIDTNDSASVPIDRRGQPTR